MILGALLDAGLSLEALRAELQKLPVAGFALQVERVMRQGIAAQHVTVVTEETHAHRHLHHITKIIDDSRLAEEVKTQAKQIFTRLAEAEAAVHNTTIERIHFHEVGALDAIVDIVGAVVGLHLLGVETVAVSPFALGTGFTNCAHGRIPLPAPATVKLLQGKPVRYTDIEAELVTPTGAAILSTLGTQFGALPDMVFDQIGYGAGTRELAIPNVLRLQIGEAAAHGAYVSDTVVLLETNIDDMNPQFYAHVFEKLYAQGALEVYTTSVMMKKQRPGQVLSVLAPTHLRNTLIDLIMQETTSIGVRWCDLQRAKAEREIVSVETTWGAVQIKVARVGQVVVNLTPEYADCQRIAQAQPTIPLKRIYQEALEKGRQLVGW